MAHGSDSDRQSRASSRHRSSSKHGSVHGGTIRKRTSRSSQFGVDDAEVIAGPSSTRKSRPRSQSSHNGFEDVDLEAGPSSVYKSRSRSRSRPSSHAGDDDLPFPKPSHTPSRHKSHRSSRHPYDDPASHRSRSRSKSGHSSKRHHHHNDHKARPRELRPLARPVPPGLGIPLYAREPVSVSRTDYAEYRSHRRNKWVSRIVCCGCGKWGIMVWITLAILIIVLGAVIGHQANSGGCLALHDVLFHQQEVHALIGVLGQESVAEGEVGHGFNLKHGLIIPLPQDLDRVPVDGVRGANNLNLTVQNILEGFLKPAGTHPPENFFLRMGPGRLVGGILFLSVVGLILAKLFSMWKRGHQHYERIPEQPHDNEDGCVHRGGLEGQWHVCETCSLIEGQR